MSTELRYVDDGSVQYLNDGDGVADAHFGGPSTATVASPRRYIKRQMKIPMAAVDTGGGIFSWQNNTGQDVIVTGCVIDVTTVATAACTISVGETATSGTTSSANLIDTLDVHTATGTFDNITDKGTNGKSRVKVPVNKWVTGSMATGASAGLVGNAYIEYHPI